MIFIIALIDNNQLEDEKSFLEFLTSFIDIFKEFNNAGLENFVQALLEVVDIAKNFHFYFN